MPVMSSMLSVTPRSRWVLHWRRQARYNYSYGEVGALKMGETLLWACFV